MADAATKKTDKIISEVAKRVKEEYKQAEKEAKKKLDKHLQKFKKDDLKKIEQVKAGKLTKAEYRKWRTEQITTTREWKEIVKGISKTYVEAGGVVSGHVKEAMYDVYTLNKNFGLFEIDKQLKGAYTFDLVDRNTVKRLIKDNPQLLPVKPDLDIPKAMKWNMQKVNSALLQGILQGEAIDKVADRLRQVTNMDVSSSMRNARTIMTAAQNAGRMDSYKEAEDMGIEMEKVWLSTLDERTRESHAEMYGEAADVDEEFSNGLMYPADPSGDPSEVYNCRCTLISRVKGVKLGLGSIDDDYTEENYENWLENRAQRMRLGYG